MSPIFRPFRRALIPLLLLLSVAPASWVAAAGKPLTFTDLMKVRTVDAPRISDDGFWVSHAAVPDRGDGVAVAASVDDDRRFEIERGAQPVISSDSRWFAALVEPSLEEREAAEGGPPEDAPKNGLELVSLTTGERRSYQRVQSFAFSPDGRWLAVHHVEEDEDEAAEGETPAGEPTETTQELPEEGVPQPATPPEPGTLPTPEEEPVIEAVPGETGEPATGEEPPEATGETAPGEEPTAQEPGAAEEGQDEEDEKDEEPRVGTLLRLVDLRGDGIGSAVALQHVTSYAFSARRPESEEPTLYLAFAVATPALEHPEREAGAENRVVIRPLEVDVIGEDIPVAAVARGRYENLTWREDGVSLAFTAAVEETPDHPEDASVWVWSAGDGRVVAAPGDAPEGWYLPVVNELAWSDPAAPGTRLFFGYRPVEDRPEPPEEDEAATGDDASEDESEEAPPFDPYDTEAILEDRAVDVWGGDDPRIIPHQKAQWEDERKRVYRAVAHLGGDGARVVPLTDRSQRVARPVDNPRAVLAGADVPYLKEITWDGWYSDLWWVPLDGGMAGRKPITTRWAGGDPGSSDVSLSPDGRWVAWFDTPHWKLFDAQTGRSRDLTGSLDTPFADEDHDYPSAVPGYGVAGWVGERGDGGAVTVSAVVVYDKYDLWAFPVAGGKPTRWTEGREAETIYRVLDLDPEEPRESALFEPTERLLLSGYDDDRKTRGLYAASVGRVGTRRLLGGPEEPRLYTFLRRAEDAPRLLFTRESYREFPDLWVAGTALDVDPPRRVTDVNPQIDTFAWGHARKVSWTGPDGRESDGVLILPDGYEEWEAGEGGALPVLIYYYRFFSQRLHEFNDPRVNHRPSFPVYASHGYAVFLPDIRFEVGNPGPSAVANLEAGVRKLIELGIADPERIGLHGHSWSGYQTAFAVTRTDLFAAAVAGAPVSNMTSAYTGIRLESGLARMFQYEKSQSRLGASLWEDRDAYIDNSPVFFADRVNTPLLIQFGDQDGAVPWQQGIELYLALRRLDKEVVMLEYRDEGHHLKSYANKLDYSIKMKEFFDHYLMGAEAPTWWSEGVAYDGE